MRPLGDRRQTHLSRQGRGLPYWWFRGDKFLESVTCQDVKPEGAKSADIVCAIGRKSTCGRTDYPSENVELGTQYLANSMRSSKC